MLIGLVYGELPFMILPLYASLEKLDRSLLEAAADLGASPLRTFWRVTVPLTLPGIVAGVVLVFIPSLGQFVVSDLLGGARSMLLGNLIQNQFAVARNKPFGAALAFELTAAVLLLLLAYALYARRKGEECSWHELAEAVARGPQRPRLHLPLRADRGARGLLLQRGPADGGLGGLHPGLVPAARPRSPPPARGPQQPARRRGDHRRGHRYRHPGRSRPGAVPKRPGDPDPAPTCR